MMAAERGHEKSIAALLECGIVPDYRGKNGITPLMAAVSKGNFECVTMLIKSGADVNAKDDLLGETPLIIAALHGHSDIAAFLLISGADPSITRNSGETALDIAKELDCSEIANILQ